MGIIMCSISIKATETRLATIFRISRDGDHQCSDPASAVRCFPQGKSPWLELAGYVKVNLVLVEPSVLALHGS